MFCYFAGLAAILPVGMAAEMVEVGCMHHHLSSSAVRLGAVMYVLLLPDPHTHPDATRVRLAPPPLSLAGGRGPAARRRPEASGRARSTGGGGGDAGGGGKPAGSQPVITSVRSARDSACI